MQGTLIGQDRIIDKINSMTIDEFPRTLLINGLCEGAGEHLVAEYIAEHLHLELDDITTKLSAELIDEIYLKPEPILYVIDTTQVDTKIQNVMLKFIEEPLKNSYIVLLADNIDMLIPTVKNRCQVWSMSSYAKETLDKFLTENTSRAVLDIAKTPGQVIDFATHNIEEMLKRANYVIDNIHRASFSNMLKLVSDIDFKNDGADGNGFSLRVWSNVLEFAISEHIKNNLDTTLSIKLTKSLTQTIKFINNSKRVGIDKQSLYYNYLINLWETMRG